MAYFVRLINSSNIDTFSNIFHCQNQEKICNNTIAKDPTTHHTSYVSLRYLVKCQCPNGNPVSHRATCNSLLRILFCYFYCKGTNYIRIGSVVLYTADEIRKYPAAKLSYCYGNETYCWCTVFLYISEVTKTSCYSSSRSTFFTQSIKNV